MGQYLKAVFSYPPITGVTINTVYLSPSFRSFLYAVAVLCLIIAVVVLRYRRKRPWDTSVLTGLLIAFFASGLLYALHADIGWAAWMRADVARFGGRTTDEKLTQLDQGLYVFSRLARDIVGDGSYRLFAPDTYLRERTEYFLLPARKREEADFVLVLADPQVRFDASAGTLIRGDLKIERLHLVRAFAADAYILRKQ